MSNTLAPSSRICQPPGSVIETTDGLPSSIPVISQCQSACGVTPCARAQSVAYLAKEPLLKSWSLVKVRVGVGGVVTGGVLVWDGVVARGGLASLPGEPKPNSRAILCCSSVSWGGAAFPSSFPRSTKLGVSPILAGGKSSGLAVIPAGAGRLIAPGGSLRFFGVVKGVPCSSR